MSVKVIALGNILMGDDGAGIVAANLIKDELLKDEIKTIIGETDFQYCLSMINEDDIIFIIDAAYFGRKPGEITLCSLADCCLPDMGYSQHGYSFIDLVSFHYRSIKGFVIGIEVDDVSFRLGLSGVLKEKIGFISRNIIDLIRKIIKEEIAVNKL